MHVSSLSGIFADRLLFGCQWREGKGCNDMGEEKEDEGEEEEERRGHVGRTLMRLRKREGEGEVRDVFS